jgi:ribosomal protein S18 acetylase RimI-like enzyme
MAKLTEPLIDKTDWYLSIIAIAPEYQSRGLGKELMMPVLREADEAGVSTYLETFVPRNIRFYERLGYAVIRELYEPVLATHYHLLRRSAGG